MMHNTEIKPGSVGTAPLSVSGPQPAWMTLNEARERAFTGEIVFEVEPEVLAYLDNGVVYYAERASDASLGRRLLDSGMIDAAQLERGTVSVGDVEHLGRLFDRDPSVDRDAVVVMVSTATEELIAEVANHSIASVRATAYRHHVSGVHRWYVVPFESAGKTRPLNAVAQFGPTTVDDALSMPFDGMEPDELTIDWIDPIDGVDDVLAFDVSMFEVDLPADTIEDEAGDVAVLDEDVVELSFELAEFVDDIDDLIVIDDIAATPEAVADTDVDHVLDTGVPVLDTDVPVRNTDVVAIAELVDELLVIDEMAETAEMAEMAQIDELVEIDEMAETIELVEADQSVETLETVDAVDTVVVEEWTPFDEASTTHESATEVAPTVDDARNAAYAVVWPDPSELTNSDDAGVQPVDDIEPQFVLPPLELVDEPEPAGANDDVAEAVRRAILVIESATIESAGSSPESDVAGQHVEIPTAAAPSATTAHHGFGGGFAPPTLETRAEALYERRAASSAVIGGPSDEVVPAESGVDAVERRSALRRLIGSLRRKDS